MVVQWALNPNVVQNPATQKSIREHVCLVWVSPSRDDLKYFAAYRKARGLAVLSGSPSDRPEIAAEDSFDPKTFDLHTGHTLEFVGP